MFCSRKLGFTASLLAVFSLSLILLSLPLTRKVEAQSQTQLVPLYTDQTPLALSNKFGSVNQSVVNQSGDYAFVGRGGSALFSRPAGSPTAVRVFQMTDEVPGYPGSRADLMQQLRINNSGLIVFKVDFAQANGVLQGILFSFDGTTLERLVAGDDPAPGSVGANFERQISLIGLNDSGDIAFTAPLVPVASGLPAQTTLYIKPNGASPVRLVGLGDTAPNTGGGTFSSLGAMNFNSAGECLFRSNIDGGSGGQGLFVATTSGVRKVVSTGDPRPEGGTFANPGPAFFNNQGEVAFQHGPLYFNNPTTGTIRAAGVGDPAPTSLGGTLGPGTQLQALNDAGEIAFISVVNSSAVTNLGLFRYRPSNPTEVVAHRNQAATGVPGQTFDNFSSVSINSSGVISFRGQLVGGGVSFAIFQQSGMAAPTNIATDGQATTLPGGGNYGLTNSFFTRTLDDNSVNFSADIPDGAATFAEFLNSGGSSTALMSTEDTLPAGASVVTRTFKVGASGDFVGSLAQHPGGAFSVVVHNITTQETSVVGTEGDVAPGTGGGRLLFDATSNTVFLNPSGNVVLAGRLVGGSSDGLRGIFVGTAVGSLAKVVIEGEVETTTGKLFRQLALNLVTPSPINATGQVVFTTTLTEPGPSVRGIFVGSAGSSPTKIALVGELLSDGRTLSNFSNGLSLNSSGQVAFLAQTPALGSGIYVGSAGTTPAKVAATGDPGPGGSTFSGFALPGFNDSGEVAFVSTLTGAPGGGAFIGTTSAAPVAIAVDGDPAPAGGNYSITTARPDAVINNQHDFLFRSNLTGGTSNSGYFVRRGPSGSVTAAVLEGQAAPGTTGGTFGFMIPGINNLVSENFQLGPDGDIAFQTSFVAPGGGSFGVWHVKTDNTIEEILVRGTVAPEFGGGTAVSNTTGTAWISGGRYAVWARISGGTFTDGVFLFVPVVTTNTPAGTSVSVTVTDSTTGTSPLALNFDNVTQAGTTSLTTSSGGPAIPTAFALGDPPVFYNIETTATFTGSISVCIDFSSVAFPPGADLRLLHFENGVWVDVTTSGPSGNIICGSVTSLSPFTVVQRLNSPPVANAGTDQTLTCTVSGGAAVTLNGSASDDPDDDSLMFEWRDENNNLVGSSAIVNLTTPIGNHTYTLSVSDGQSGSSVDSVNITVNPRELTVLAPANVWIGLKNSDDVGTRFDLLAEVFEGANLVGSGQLNSVPGGSSGFNNANLQTIPLNLSSSASFCGGGTLSIKLSVRVAADSGHRSGTARLWYNDAQANSNFGATIGDASSSYYLLNAFALGASPGPGPKKTIDVKVDRSQNGNLFKPFGTWTITVP